MSNLMFYIVRKWGQYCIKTTIIAIKFHVQGFVDKIMLNKENTEYEFDKKKVFQCQKQGVLQR